MSSFSRRVSSRRKYQYDMRTGFKVFGRDLYEDGEKPGILTRDRDDEHPQRYVGNILPDRTEYVRSTPNPAAIPAVVRIGFQREPGTNERIAPPHIGLAPPDPGCAAVEVSGAFPIRTSTPVGMLLLTSTTPPGPISLDVAAGAAAVAIT